MPATSVIEITCRRCGKKVMRHSQAKYCEECSEIIYREQAARPRYRKKDDEGTRLRREQKRVRAVHKNISDINQKARDLNMSYGTFVACVVKVAAELKHKKQRFKEANER